MSEERTYYLTFDDLSTDRLYDLIKYHKENRFGKYNILKILGITDLPVVLALPNIW